MKTVTQHERLGTIVYEESFWTGKKKITWNGFELEKQDKKTFAWYNGVEWRTAKLKGNFLAGVKIYIEEECIQLVPPVKWYEIVCSMLIIIFNLVWGNSVALCSIFPIVGGALGGGISGALAVFCILFMKYCKKVGVKLAVWFGMFLAMFIVCFLLAISLFPILI